jgi:cell division protein FtsL
MLAFFTIGIVFFSIFMYLGIMSFFDRFSSFESIIFIYMAIIILLFTLSMVKLFYKVMIRRVNHIFELIEQHKWESNDQ